MEGITTYIFRNALHKYYGGVDAFYSPFISTHRNKNLSNKELRDILPENNAELTLIPQVLSSNAQDFLSTIPQITELGYKHINLNFGCPSGTVTAKGKGAGILLDPHNVEMFLDAIFTKADYSISVKTRLGFDFYEEWEDLLKVYKKFPLKELTIHARVRQDFYKGTAKWEIVRDTLEDSSIPFPIIYNGDIFTPADASLMQERMPSLYGIMIGRGLITNPGLALSIKENRQTDMTTFKAFHTELLANYQNLLCDERNTLFKIKELWPYMASRFEDSAKLLKMVQKCKSIREYESILRSL